MAKQRYINTKFWSDSYISNLDPVEKLLFLYLLTNERTNICGMYELPLKYMAVETGIDKDMILKILQRFQDEKKVVYQFGWVYVINFPKHQDLDNPKIVVGILTGISAVPSQFIEYLDTLSIAYPYPSNNSNSNSNSNRVASKDAPLMTFRIWNEDIGQYEDELVEKKKTPRRNVEALRISGWYNTQARKIRKSDADYVGIKGYKILCIWLKTNTSEKIREHLQAYINSKKFDEFPDLAVAFTQNTFRKKKEGIL